MNVINVALYVRVSTEEQAKHGFSIQAQKENLEEYCKQKNYKIIDTYIDEGKSARAKINNRTELKRLLEDIEQKKIDRIVFIKLDRWFRNISDYYKVQELLDKYKVDWETTQEDYNTTTSSGRLNLNIRLSIAQDEADRTADRIRFTFDSMIKNKRARVGKQGLPLGYNVFTLEDGKKVVKKDEEEKEMVEEIFNHYSTYGSIRKTLIYINGKYNQTIHYPNLSKMLRNEFYTGKYRDVEDYTEAYLTKEQFDEIQELLSKNKGYNRAHKNYIFAGLIVCSECGGKLSGYTHSTGNYKYLSYRCYKHSKRLCNNSSTIIEQKLEKQVINDFFKEVDERKKIIKEPKKNFDEKKLDRLKNRLDKVNELYLESRITRKKYDDEYLNITKEIDVLQNEKSKTQQNIKKELSLSVLDVYNKLDSLSKNAFWKKYIDYIENKKNKIFIVHFK